MVYLGVDLHRNRSVVAALNENGDVLFSRRIESRPEAFQRIFGELKLGSLSVAFEATYGWYWLADLLRDAGIEAHMAHPLATKAIATARVKNDSVDARTLAHLLRTHLLPEAWIAPTPVRERRRLARTRTSLVRIRSRLLCQLHGILADHCIHPPTRTLLCAAGREFLMAAALSPLERGRIDAAMRLIDEVTAEVKLLDQELRAAFAGDTRIAVWSRSRASVSPPRRSCSRRSESPAASPAPIACAAGRGSRRRSARATCRRVAGTSPSRARAGCARVLVEAAARPVRHPMLRRFKEGVASRRGTKIATVALARLLLTLCFYALRDDEGCRAFPVHARARTSRSADPGALVVRHDLSQETVAV